MWKRLWRSNCPLQVLLIILFWQAGNAVAWAGGLPVPGAVIGLFLVLAFLFKNRSGVHLLRRGAQWLFAGMLLFLLPSVLSLLDHRELFGVTGLKVFAVILLGTFIVMIVTALVMELCCRWMVAPKNDDYA